MPIIVEHKYPFRNTLLRYNIPARRFPKQNQLRDLALEGFGYEEVLHVLALVFVGGYSLHAGLCQFDETPKVAAFVDALLTRHPYVLYIDLWGNGLRDIGVYELLLKRSTRTAPIFRNLRVLNLNRTGITNVGMAHVFRFMQMNAGSKLNNIRCLSFANNRLSLLSHELLQQTTTSLLSLDLSDSELGPRGATVLSNYLRTNFALRFLGSSFNRFSSTGVQRVLAAVLAQITFVKKQLAAGFAVAEGRRGLQRLCLRGNGALDRKCIATVFQLLEQAPWLPWHRLEYLDLRLNIVDRMLWAKFQAMMRDSECDFQELRHVVPDVSENAGIDNGVEFEVISGDVHGLDLRGVVLRPPTEFFYDNIAQNTLREQDFDQALNVTKMFSPYGPTRSRLMEEDSVIEAMSARERQRPTTAPGCLHNQDAGTSASPLGGTKQNYQLGGSSSSTGGGASARPRSDHPGPGAASTANAANAGAPAPAFADTETVGTSSNPATGTNTPRGAGGVGGAAAGGLQLSDSGGTVPAGDGAAAGGAPAQAQAKETSGSALPPVLEQLAEGLEQGMRGSRNKSPPNFKNVEERDKWVVSTQIGDRPPIHIPRHRPPIVPPSNIDPLSLIPPDQIDRREVRPRLSAQSAHTLQQQMDRGSQFSEFFPFGLPPASGELHQPELDSNFPGVGDSRLVSPFDGLDGSSHVFSPAASDIYGRTPASRPGSSRRAVSAHDAGRGTSTTSNQLHAGRSTRPSRVSSAQNHERQRMMKEFGNFLHPSLRGEPGETFEVQAGGGVGPAGRERPKIYHRGLSQYRLKRNLKNEVEEFERVVALLEKEKSWLQ